MEWGTRGGEGAASESCAPRGALTEVNAVPGVGRARRLMAARKWQLVWARLCPDLIDGLPPEALHSLRIAFDLHNASSIEDFFRRLNSKGAFTGKDREEPSDTC